MRVVDDQYSELARTGWRGRIVEDRLREMRADQERARLVREIRTAQPQRGLQPLRLPGILAFLSRRGFSA